MLHRMMAACAACALLISGILCAAEPPKPHPNRPQQLLVPTDDATLAKIKELVKDLGGEDAAKSAAASKALIELGGVAFEHVMALRKDKNPEVAKRSMAVVKEIEVRSKEMVQSAREKQADLMRRPMDLAGLKAVQAEYKKAADYVAPNAGRQNCKMLADKYTQDIKNFETASATLEQYNRLLAGPPSPEGLRRATIQAERAKQLEQMRRFPEAQAAIDDAIVQSGENKRLLPDLLLQQARLYQTAETPELAEVACKKILNEHPLSLEVRQAFELLLTLYETTQRFDEMVETLKAYAKDYPLDEGVQETLYRDIDLFLTVHQDGLHASRLGEYAMEAYPPSRLRPNALAAVANYNEYIVLDYPKAYKAQKMIVDFFPEMAEADLAQHAVERLQQKKDGKFPAPPDAKDPGPAGSLAKFIQAVKSQDLKAVTALTPKEEEGLWEFRFMEVTPQVRYSDLVVERVDMDEKNGKASMNVAQYVPDQAKPLDLKVRAVLQEGKWRIIWPSPADMPGFHPAEMKLPDGMVMPPPNNLPQGAPGPNGVPQPPNGVPLPPNAPTPVPAPEGQPAPTPAPAPSAK